MYCEAHTSQYKYKPWHNAKVKTIYLIIDKEKYWKNR